MSSLRLGKKLQPAKRAWKSFSTRLQSRVHKVNIPKAIKSTYKQLLVTLHSLTSRTTPHAASNHHVHRHSKKNIPAVRIDDLFAEHASSSIHLDANKGHHARGETSRGKEVAPVGMEEDEEDMGGGSSGIETIEDAWKIVVAKSPKLQVDEKTRESKSPQLQVDEKAEEFISKFHQDMRIQKERSLLESQERLDRNG
ncbi:uncharacterized protein LOC130718211 [Lotus japonicus]|uniref:DUF761 domain-containing protein n=1 Tax=Lotus japonicus TaxID=34305 RepID=I3SEC5_LOTJA|nr:uncharacterized protein LOC130718211 [Lotus japonicus]AFK38617.1 unknown [Lotus japonicus]